MKLHHVPDTAQIGHFTSRAEIANLLRKGSIGIELGVAEGNFSYRLLDTGQFEYLYSIDMWAGDRGHDTRQYQRALKLLEPFKNKNTCIRMTFDDALELFDDNYFDFIYIDGYAHTGQESGKTLETWWPKLKPNGVFAGDDYSKTWPLVTEQVDKFIISRNLELFQFKPKLIEDKWSKSPSWITVKPGTSTIALVGNGPVSTENESFIDASDFVIRFNRASLAGKAGKRTDALVLVNHGTPGHGLLDKKGVNEAALIAQSIWFTKTPNMLRRWNKDKNFGAVDWTELLINRYCEGKVVEFIPETANSDINKLLTSFGKGKNKTASTGALVIAFLLRNFPDMKIKLFGFSHTGWDGHPWEAERLWIDQLAREGKVMRY